MLAVKEISITPIKSLDYQKTFNETVELMPVSNDLDINNWGDILRSHHNTIVAGTGKHNIYGIENHLVIESDKNLDAIKTVIQGFFTGKFSERNILSIKLKNSGNKYEIGVLIYPLVIRALTPERWFDISDSEEYRYNSDTLSSFCTFIGEIFKEEPVFDERTGYQGSSSKGTVAQVDLIKDMTLPDASAYDYKERIYDAYGTQIQKQKDMSSKDYQTILKQTISYFTTGVAKNLYKDCQAGKVKLENFLKEVQDFIKDLKPDVTENDLKSFFDEIITAVFGNYILEPLLNADDISDIKIISPKEIRVKCNGKRMTSNVTFIDDADYWRFIEAIATRFNMDLNSKAIHVRTDNRSNPKFIMRINLTTPYINSNGYCYLHMRKIRKKKMTTEELIQLNCMPRHVCDYLRKRINTSSLVFCGKGGSGKTTMMNTLIEEIAWDKSGLVIQESEELFSANHPDFMFQHLVPEENGRPGYSLQDEARNGLLTDLDYFIIGEIKGGEALYFLNAAMTGHKCICSVHAPDSRAAIDKLADYVMYESPYSKEQAMYMLKEMNTIVYMENFKVKEISEIIGYNFEKKELEFKLVYKL